MAHRSPSLGRTTGLFVVAVALVALLVGAPGALEEQQAGAYAAAAATDGSLSMTNSRDGAAILTAGGMKPGSFASGTVTITNAGDVEGAFALSESHLEETPGAYAGVLSQRLDLVVEDVTDGAAAETVYTGKLGAMPERPLGTFESGEARTYRFEARLPEGGIPLSNSTEGNAYQASTTSFQFDWTATESDDAGPESDTVAPRLTLRVKKRQRARRKLVVLARCDEPCRLGVTGRLSVPKSRKKAKIGSRRLTRMVPARRWKKLKVKLPRKAVAAAERGLAARRRVKVTLRVTAQDAAGNVSARNFRIKLKK